MAGSGARENREGERARLAQAATQREAETLVAEAAAWVQGANAETERRAVFTGEKVQPTAEGVTRTRGGEVTHEILNPQSLDTLHAESARVAEMSGNEAIHQIINGQNSVEFRERVAEGAKRIVQELQIHQTEDAPLFTLLHERVEAVFRTLREKADRGEAGGVTLDEARGAIAALAPHLDPAKSKGAEERALFEQAQKVARGEANETELRETLSELAVAEVLRRRKEGGVISGRISEALGAAIDAARDPKQVTTLGKLRATINALHTYFRAVLGTVAALRHAKSEGRTTDFEALIDRLTGRDEQAAHERYVAAEVEAIAREHELDYKPPTEEEMDAGVAFSLKKGASLDSQKKEIPKTLEAMPQLDDRGTFEDVQARAVEWMLANPTAIAPDGRTILIANPENGSLENRAEHWMGSYRRGDAWKHSDRQMRLGKARSIAAIPSTIRGAQAKAEKGGAFIYLRRYSDGSLHTAWTDDRGKVTEHGIVSGGVETQFTLDRAQKIEGAKIVEDWTEKVAPAPPVNQQADAGVDRATAPGRQPESQQGGTPDSPAQEQLDAGGDIVKDAGGTTYRISAGSRLELMQRRIDESMARDPDARRKVGRRMQEKLDELRLNAETLRFTGKGDEIRSLVEKRSSGELDKEQAFRQAARADELIAEGMSKLTPETLQSVEAGARKLAEQPIANALLNEAGRLMSRTEAVRRSPASAQEYDGAPWLPAHFWGGTLRPDEAAQILADAGMLKDGYPDTLWKALGDEVKAAQRANAQFAEAVKAARQARNAAREEAAEWRRQQDEMQKKDWSPRARLLRDLRALDAMLSVLPPEIRGKVGGFVKLATLGSDKARLEEIKRRIAKIDGLLEAHLQKECTVALEKLLEKAAPKREAGEQSRGKLGAEGHRYFDEVERARGLTAEQVEEERGAIERAYASEALTNGCRFTSQPSRIHVANHAWIFSAASAGAVLTNAASQASASVLPPCNAARSR